MIDQAQNARDRWLSRALALAKGDTPFPWQQELLTRFTSGVIDRSLDIPTGLGKTGVMAIWLVARALSAPLPRRLVYAVDRRAVVDQATDVAEGLRAFVEEDAELRQALGLHRALPISTLRGLHVDNKEWLEDPASPAIIVGTVDMIGSRLLFEGYGVSRKMRPYHAGLLGADTLVVLDEAHLVPPFEKLLEAITDRGSTFGSQDEVLRTLIPPFRLLSLSATGRTIIGQNPFGLQAADMEHPVVKRRLDAPKRVTTQPLGGETALETMLAERAWVLTDSGRLHLRIIVFSDKRTVAESAKATVDKLARGDRKTGVPGVEICSELLIGARRVREREEAARSLRACGFIAGSKVERKCASFLFATSAGEVGVDLDADHMVSDLVAWERMVQRLGRVNRRGDGEAQVVVVTEPASKEAEKARGKPLEERTATELRAIAETEAKDAVLQLIDHLPQRGGTPDGSPGALRALKLSSSSHIEVRRLLDAATTPAPLRPALSRALVDAWSMTSLEEHTGRPQIEPWIRGWVDDAPQTSVVWRRYLPVRSDGRESSKQIEDIEGFFEAAPPHASEALETETFRILAWLEARAKTLLVRGPATSKDDKNGEARTEREPLDANAAIAVVLTHAGDWKRTLRLRDLDFEGEANGKNAKKRKEEIERLLMGGTLVVDSRVSGLNEDGLLDTQHEDPPRTVDDGEPWMPSTADVGKPPSVPVVGFRVGVVDAAQPAGSDTGWRESYRLAIEVSKEGAEPTRYLIVQNAATEERRSTGQPQLIDDHELLVEQRSRSLGGDLRLPEGYTAMLATAAKLHDEGKRSKRWQRAFNAEKDGREYAKTCGPINFSLLDGYRHEFGSLQVAAGHAALAKLGDDNLKDLALHLIAAHHGFARPVIGVSGCEDAPPSALEERAREVALRFARLQKRWGPWGLAWWEALLRAADQQASRAHDENRPTADTRSR